MPSDEERIAALEALTGKYGTTTTHTRIHGSEVHLAAPGGGTYLLTTGSNWIMPYTNGTGATVELAVGAASTVMQGQGVTAAPTWETIPHLSGLADIGATPRVTLNTASPHLTLTGDVSITGALTLANKIIGPDSVTRMTLSAGSISGTADAAVTTTTTTLTDTRLAMVINAYVGLAVFCNGKSLTVTSNTATTFTGTSWSGGTTPGNGFAWLVTGTVPIALTGNVQGSTSGVAWGVNAAVSANSALTVGAYDLTVAATQTILSIPAATAAFLPTAASALVTVFAASAAMSPSGTVTAGSILGMNFGMAANFSGLANSATATMAALTGASTQVAAGNLVSSSSSRTLNITAMTGYATKLTFQAGGTSSTSEALAVTTAVGYLVTTPTFVTSGTTPTIVVTTLLGIDIQAVAKSLASTTVTTAIQLRVGDITGSSFTAANNRIVQFGSATPTTTSGLFEVMANFAAGANLSPLFVSEGATPTRRQFQTFNPGLAGVNFTNGQLVWIAV